jgi:hypothetical protein
MNLANRLVARAAYLRANAPGGRVGSTYRSLGLVMWGWGRPTGELRDVAGWVLEQNLLAAGPFEDVVAELGASVTETT